MPFAAATKFGEHAILLDAIAAGIIASPVNDNYTDAGKTL